MTILRSGEVLSLLMALTWAVAVILFRRSGERVPPVALNLFKGLVGWGLILITLLVLDRPLVPAAASPRDWVFLLVSGAVGIGVADTLFFVCLNRLGAGRSAIVDCLYSPCFLLCSLIYLGEPVGVRLLLGIALMVGAVGIGAWQPPPEAAAASDRSFRIGVLLGALGMLLMAAAVVGIKPILDRSDPWWVAEVRLTGGLLFLGLQALLPRHRAAAARALRPGPAWRFMLPAAFLGTYLAMILLTAGMKYTTTVTASVLNQSGNVWIMVLAWLALKEPLGRRQWAAIALGFAAVALAVG